ncbi:MAG: serine--tRNA ligase [Methanothrix sp.]|uniref:Type-2 serine--tRNA ligase n=1 Tax=Methanothrix harundinacea TaxID=301375 RepID=A0A117MCQ5_9EURY|nr:MAG: Type-2 serine--tRNA ligase [Methanothrix harundinacea]KUK96864.1 MAG: Type-2 serine--tRNA ligase [Methanothrix harundinacea]MCP1391912.1 serine--tRNA ligase [Methanothrix harundinacea]MDD3709328.1 serine--tRNA ligase [Methanothrix sp.]MDI9399438.1 serine--tRNA ligase [Euryarchaeota archaeon]
MKFHLEGSFRLSAEAGDAVKDLEEFFGGAAEILKKGAADGKGAEITSWKLGNTDISVVIDSDRYVRAHDAVLRLRRPLADLLGKKYRVGVRGIEISKYEIEVASERSIDHKIPHVKEMKHEGGVLTLSLEVDESDLKNQVPDRIVSLLDEKLAAEDYGGKAEHWELLWESEPRVPKFERDPTEELVNRGWIKHGASRGQWIYGPEGTHLFRVLERIVLEEIIEPLGYREMIFPKLVTWDVWKKSGHALGVYPEIYYVCPPKTRDPEFWEEVMDYYKVTREVPVELVKEKIDNPIGGMCYAQCPPSWVFFQGRTLPNEDLPIRIFDRSGTSHRYESGGIHGIERVDEFHRIEIVWMGSQDQVKEEAEKLKECYTRIFEEILELRWRMAWVTPWFMAQEGKSGLSEMTGAGTVDYEAILPYNGDWIEFQNLSINGDKYPRGFNVKAQSGEQLWSGCSGVGLERWTSAFLGQKGLDPENWPEAFRERFGEMPKGIRFL